ncbi:MAG TPA: hypothetical protein VHJ82_04745 [Actinomycetota bacterium]|nr:hypothetical protein [Actinomycetota bacterium]
MFRVRLLSLTLAALTLGATIPSSAPARNRAGKEFSFSGKGCVETEAFFLVDPAVLDPYVPDKYKIAVVFAGKGELMVTITDCDEISVNGKRGRPGIIGKAGIYIEPPIPSRLDFDYYGLWQVGNVAALRKGFGKLGLESPFVKNPSFSSTTGDYDADASMPQPVGPYRIRMANPAGVDVLVGYDSTFWYETRAGTVTVAQTAEPTYRTGLALFETSPDSAVGAMIGGATRPADSGTLAHIPVLEAMVRRVP